LEYKSIAFKFVFFETRLYKLLDNFMKDEYLHVEHKAVALITVLWTGGMDSSCRMIQLSKSPVHIQPVYLMDNRRSEQKELNAISEITRDIKNHPETRCTILPLLKYAVADIPPDKHITEAYLRLHALTSIGSQYDWLARFAKLYPGIEISFEKCETNKTYICMHTKGSYRKVTEGDISYAELEKAKTDPDLYAVFGNFHFPLPLFETVKSEELKEFKRLGFEHSIQKTWFCHKPIKNEPCGVCKPCQSVVEEGLTFRLPQAALRRYNAEMKYGNTNWYNYYKKIRRHIMGY